MLYFGLGLSQNAVLGSDVIGREGGGNGMLIHNYLVLFRMVVVFFCFSVVLRKIPKYNSFVCTEWPTQAQHEPLQN